MDLDPRGWLSRYLDGEEEDHDPLVEGLSDELSWQLNRRREGNRGRGRNVYATTTYEDDGAMIGIYQSVVADEPDPEPFLEVGIAGMEEIATVQAYPDTYDPVSAPDLGTVLADVHLVLDRAPFDYDPSTAGMTAYDSF